MRGLLVEARAYKLARRKVLELGAFEKKDVTANYHLYLNDNPELEASQ